MNKKYIIGGFAALALIAAAVFMVDNKSIEYMDVARASESGRTAKISGTWVKDRGQHYDAEKNQFYFCMRDDKGTIIPVVLDGAKPNNFELSESVVATGTISGDTLVASNVLTKCPSKYEGSDAQLGS